MDYRTIWEQQVFGSFRATPFPQRIETSGSGDVVELFRYVLSDVLQWDAWTAADRMSKSLLEFLKLSRMSRHLPCPAGVDMDIDKRYIAEAVWPDELHVTRKDRALEVYEAVCDGKLARFPKNFFHGADCAEIACVCLLYAINRYSNVATDEELFLRAADTRAARTWLTKRKLLTVCDDLFNGDPLDFLRHAMADFPETEALASYAAFRQTMLDVGARVTVSQRDAPARPVCVRDALQPFEDRECPAGYTPRPTVTEDTALAPWIIDPPKQAPASPGNAPSPCSRSGAEPDVCHSGFPLSGAKCPSGLTLETCKAYTAFRKHMREAVVSKRQSLAP